MDYALLVLKKWKSASTNSCIRYRSMEVSVSST